MEEDSGARCWEQGTPGNVFLTSGLSCGLKGSANQVLSVASARELGVACEAGSWGFPELLRGCVGCLSPALSYFWHPPSSKHVAVHPENTMNTLLARARWWSPLLDAAQEESERLQPPPGLEVGLCGRRGLLGRGRSWRVPCPPEQTRLLEKHPVW